MCGITGIISKKPLDNIEKINESINRLKNRGHDPAFIKKRMQLANLQREKKELYQYHVDNEDIKTSVNQILDIIYELEES